MKERSLKVPALKDLLERPFDLGTVELAELAVRTAGSVDPSCAAFRSLKPHGSSPERVLDLLCFLVESSDKKMQQMELENITMELLTAARSALREAIGKAKLAVKEGETCCLPVAAPGSKALPKLRALDARVSILMMRLKQEAEKKNDRCLQEVA